MKKISIGKTEHSLRDRFLEHPGGGDLYSKVDMMLIQENKLIGLLVCLFFPQIVNSAIVRY